MTTRTRAGQPVTTGGFVGRAAQLDRILHLLQSSAQLITLTGTGGIGKTQLAAEAMRRYRKVKPVPVYWVRLAHLPKTADRTAVTDEIARSVIDVDTSRRSAWDAVVASLSPQEDTGRSTQTVLVLDNCEHILAGVGPVIADILHTVPQLTIVATSRTVIGWSDEYLIEVPPLPAQDAADLFLYRAQALGQPIEGKAQLAAVEAICRHMQNTPLFIRLAAAQLRRRPLTGILRDLDRVSDEDRRMGWSSGPSAAGDIRHHSIGDAIAWSYELCDDKERLLFERLSVFAAGYGIDPEYGGFAMGAEPEAIVEVCSDDAIVTDYAQHSTNSAEVRLSREEIPALLDHLVDRSLVSLQIRGNSVRYSLMECLHVFARQRLEARSTDTVSEATRLSLRHLRYYHDRFRRAAVDWVGPREQHIFDWVRSAWPNLMVAARTSLTRPEEAVLGLRICIAIHAFPVPITHTSSIREIRAWTERTLAATASMPDDASHTRTTAKALVAYCALRQGMREDAERLLDECLTLCGVPSERRASPDPGPELPAAVEFLWGMVLWTLHSNPRAVPLLASAQRKALDNGEDGFAAIFESAAVGAAARMPTSPQQVDELIDDMLHRAQEVESSWAMTWAYLIKAVSSIERGHPSVALDCIHNAQRLHISASDQLGWVILLRAWALGQAVVDVADNTERRHLMDRAVYAAYLFGAQSALHSKLGMEIQLLPNFADRNERTITSLKGFLGADAFDEAYERGTRIPPRISAFEKIVKSPLELRKAKRPAGGGMRKAPWDALSRAEQSVAILASAGITNAMIAARRGTSTRTVEAQLAAVLRKLQIVSRHEIEQFIPDERTAEVRQEAERWNRGNRRRRSLHPADIPPHDTGTSSA